MDLLNFPGVDFSCVGVCWLLLKLHSGTHFELINRGWLLQMWHQEKKNKLEKEKMFLVHFTADLKHHRWQKKTNARWRLKSFHHFQTKTVCGSEVGILNTSFSDKLLSSAFSVGEPQSESLFKHYMYASIRVQLIWCIFCKFCRPLNFYLSTHWFWLNMTERKV